MRKTAWCVSSVPESRVRHNENFMKKADTNSPTPLKSGVTRGKYAHLLQSGSNIAVLDPDIVDHFPDSESVNNALRAFLAFGQQLASVIPSVRRPARRSAGVQSPAKFDPRKGIAKARALAAK